MVDVIIYKRTRAHCKLIVSLILLPKATDHKLHVPSARRFGASGRNLFAQICGGYDFFGQGYAIILKKDQFKLVPDDWIVIDNIADATDKLNDLLRQMITWRSFASYHYGSWDKRRGWIPFYSIVQSDDVQTIQQLSLILMYAFYLSNEISFNSILCHFKIV